MMYINLIASICTLMCGSKKYPYSPHGKSLEIPRGGGGVLKAKLLEEKYEAKLEFPTMRDKSVETLSFHSVFHSFHGLMNSINWPASSVWVFIAQAGRALQR